MGPLWRKRGRLGGAALEKAAAGAQGGGFLLAGLLLGGAALAPVGFAMKATLGWWGVLHLLGSQLFSLIQSHTAQAQAVRGWDRDTGIH